MNTKTTFLAAEDLFIIEGEDTIVVRRGFLHINEVSIDKDKSSKSFVNLFRDFAKNRSITLEDSSEHYDDFMKLARFRLIDIESNEDFLVVVDDAIYEALSPLVSAPTIRVTECLSSEALKGGKSSGDQVASQFVERIGECSHVYYLGLFRNLSRLRAVNKMLFDLDVEYTIGFIDEGDVYALGVRPRYTGCYSCLEHKIMTRFPGYIEDYRQASTGTEAETINAQLLMLASLIETDQRNISVYGSSSLTGSVAHFYMPNFEFCFENNTKAATCKVCSGINNARFEEQNARSINLVLGAE